MKKLIAISVVFALVAGAAFAVDVGASVIGTVKVLQGDTGKDANGDSHKVTGGGGMKHVRIDGSGEAGENFGGYFRVCSDNGIIGNAWWKPIDQFKLQIGGNGGDGFIGKEGVTGWMFYQTVTDTGVAMEGGNVWGWHNGTGNNLYEGNVHTRWAFFEQGDGQDDLYLYITPMDMLAINFIFPFISKHDQEAADIFKQTIAQLDLNIEGVGNIALTYAGGRGYKKGEAGTTTPGTLGNLPTADTPTITIGKDDYFVDGSGNLIKVVGATPAKTVGAKEGYNESPGSIFLYYGGSFGDLSIDFGLGFHLAEKRVNEKTGDAKSYNMPVGIGLGVKYAMETLGVKFRTVVAIPMEDDQNMEILADFLPYFVINDNMTAFVGFGLGMAMPSKDEKEVGGDAAKSLTGWHFNPYLQVGEEWGAKFLFGFKVWSEYLTWNDTKNKWNDSVVKWAVPIALNVSF